MLLFTGGLALVLFVFAPQLAADFTFVGIADKQLRPIAHMVTFGGMAVLLAYALNGRWIIAALVIAAFSSLEEVHQIWVPGRYASLQDVLVNCIAIFLAIYLVRGLWGNRIKMSQ